MQQSSYNHAELLHELSVSHKSATKIFDGRMSGGKIPLAGRMAVKSSAGGLYWWN